MLSSCTKLSPFEPRLLSVLDNPYEGVLAIDELGKIFFVSSLFLELLKRSEPEVLGSSVHSLLPDCRLPETLTQNYSIWGETLRINDRELLVARFPIRVEGRIAGAMLRTIVPDQKIAREIVQKLSRPTLAMNSANGLCTCHDIIGESEPMLYVKKLARRASRTSSTLLITGESGTGKEIIAQAIHTRSVRREAPFITVNCSAIPEDLLESELFGYVDGAFTGARKGGKPGKFELANGGTILLDEIGEMPLYMQVKLLRVLQERMVWRVGATTPTLLDVRVMASTNTDLQKLVQQGKFREDLYYRLKVLEINMPPLRDRLDDLPMLVDGLIQRINANIGTNAKGIQPESLKILQACQWRGNVRELANILEQAINWSDDPIIDLQKVPGRIWESPSVKPESSDSQGLRERIESTERELIFRVLEQTDGNKSEAARLLGIRRSVLYKKLERLAVHTS
ncbi:MAG TPA: sigma 54-interacting transcriptional regulator [candidate division Zixibacteria bacterium]|nr:sigma 54-interacting transcriptional regulator [candidate division Zixibacteria bacterium]